MTWAGLI